MSLVPILRCWKWSGLLVRKAVTIARIPRVSEKYKSECIEFNYSNNTLQWTEHSAIFSEVQPRNHSQKNKYVSFCARDKINFLNKVSRIERKWEETRTYIYFFNLTHLCVVSWPRLVSVYGPFLILGPRSLHKEWYSIHWRLGANRVTFLKGWCSRRWIEVWNELNRTVWSGLVRASKMKHINGLRVKCGHNLYNEPQSESVIERHFFLKLCGI